jgi:hypothetical protein
MYAVKSYYALLRKTFYIDPFGPWKREIKRDIVTSAREAFYLVHPEAPNSSLLRALFQHRIINTPDQVVYLLVRRFVSAARNRRS